jgi:hypothetical protein
MKDSIMTLPPWIDLNGQRIELATCNVYQKFVYEALTAEIRKAATLTEERERIKQEGVIDYLAERLIRYGTLTDVQNIYASHDR